MKASVFKKILFDYFDGNTTSIQQKLIEEWLTDVQNKELFYQYLDEWEQQHPQYIFDTELGLKKVYENIENPEIDKVDRSKNAKEINFYPYLQWMAAASIVLVFAWLGWTHFTRPALISYDKLVKETKNQAGEIYEKVNFTANPILVNLPDKSSVILQPKSKISYSPKQFNKSKREIILSGEAFFEIKKNAAIPFFVYTNELITKVLGTSFSIKSQKETSEIEVIVKTGKVAVFLQYDADRALKVSNKSLDGLVLNANEKVKINRNEYKIDKPAHVDQNNLQLPIQTLTFNFDDTPIITVLKELEKAYSIDIVYNPEKLANCKLTAHLSDEPLIEKLDLICTALEASYQEVDNKFIFKSNGCR